MMLSILSLFISVFNVADVDGFRGLRPVFFNHFPTRLHMTHSKSQELKVVSYNILAPCYKRLPSPKRLYESESEDMYLARNALICDQLLETSADVICIQEFWSANTALRNLYEQKLCAPGGQFRIFCQSCSLFAL